MPAISLDAALARLLAPSADIGAAAPSLAGARVLLRLDLNVPLTAGGGIGDENRLTAALPAIRTLLAAGARVAIASHLGRPEPGKQSWGEMAAAFSLAPVAARLAELLPAGAFAGLAPDCIGPAAEAAVAALAPGQACLLENTRFHAGDVDDDDAFASALGGLADVLVTDAFGVMHREQGSVTVRRRRRAVCMPARRPSLPAEGAGLPPLPPPAHADAGHPSPPTPSSSRRASHATSRASSPARWSARRCATLAPRCARRRGRWPSRWAAPRWPTRSASSGR